MKVASTAAVVPAADSLPSNAAAENAGRRGSQDEGAGAGVGAGTGNDRRRQQLLLPAGTLRSSGGSSSSSSDDSTASSPLALSLLGRMLGRAQRLFGKPPAWLPMVMLLHNQFIFAGMHVIAKPALRHIPPFALALMRISLAVPFLFLLAWKEGSLPKLTKWRQLPSLLLIATIGVALPQTLIFVANQLAGPAIIAVLSPAAPVYAAVFAAALCLERVTWIKSLGILLCVVGALVVLRPDKMDFHGGGAHTDLTAGVFVMIFQTMCYAAFLVALKIKLATDPYPFGIYAWASLLGALLIGAVSLATGRAAFDVRAVPESAWGAVVYCGIVVSFWAHACNAYAVKYTSASIPALFSCLSPFLTGFLAFLVLHETIGSASDIIGLALNIFGLLAVIYSKLRLETPAPGQGSCAAGGSNANGSQVQPMPAGGSTEQDEDGDDADDAQLPPATASVTTTATATGGIAKVMVMAAPPPAIIPAFVPGKLTSVPEEREATASAPPSPAAARDRS